MTPSALINKNSTSKQIHMADNKTDKNESRLEPGNMNNNIHSISVNENQTNLLEKHRNLKKKNS